MDPGKLDKHEEYRTLKDYKCNKTLDIFGIPKILESLESLGNLEPWNLSGTLGTLGSPEEEPMRAQNPAEPYEPSAKCPAKCRSPVTN